MEFLWTGVGEPPQRYTDYVLCKTFGALPSQLDEEDAEAIHEFLICMSGEAEIQKRRSVRKG